MPTLVAVFDQPRTTAEAARHLLDRGFTNLEIYSPAAFHELEKVVSAKPSRVRLWTLIGGLTGVTTGYAMTIWMANNWQIMLGGKPFSSIPPYTIIAFELTILFGGVLTVLGCFFHARLFPRKLDAAYSPRFSAEEFGLVVSCLPRDVAEVEALLRAHAAQEVSLVEP
jgi:hypothetical protein